MTDSGGPADERDRAWIRRALDLARRGWGQTAPNPMVGAVVVRDGVAVGEGFHARAGEPHAEVVALAAAGPAARGSTVYVTLEPCAHHGRTPPCTDALITAGVARVVIATADTNPVAAGGAARLRAAGITVTSGIAEAEARELNAPFFFAQHARRPWITLKLAVSREGALTDAARSSVWLTGPQARQEVHRMRAGADAIAVGAGTARIDDPLLTVRGDVIPRVPPRRVVFDDRLETPVGARLLTRTAEPVGDVVVVATRAAALADPARAAQLEAAGATVIVAASLQAALERLRGLGIRSLLAEGGAGLAGRLLEAAVVDRLVIFQAPVILGAGALDAFARAPSSLARTVAGRRIVDERTFGDDRMTIYALNEP